MAVSSDDPIQPPANGSLLPRHLCRVMGLNQNHSSRSGTPYHLQIEDRGPVFDDAREGWVRRVNVIVCANYGEATARIVYGRDHDLPDIRTHAHNRVVAQRIQELASEAREAVEEREDRQVHRIKVLLERYYRGRDERVKREIEEANGLYPFIFARAVQELRAGRTPAAEEAPVPPADETEIVYPLEDSRRELVLEIERVAEELQRDLAILKARGAADAILQATCAKLLARAKENLARRDTSADFATRHLEMTRNSLVTAFRQVRAQLSREGGA